MARNKAPGGIVTRHSRKCSTHTGSARCNCTPTYEAWVWDNKVGAKVRRSFPGDLDAARSWVADATRGIKHGTVRAKESRETVEEAAGSFLAGVKEGRVLAKGQKPYKPSTVRSYATSLERHVYPKIGWRRLTEVTAPDLQDLVNEMISEGVNASTLRNTINPLRAIYRNAIRAGNATINPCLGLGLPSVDSVRDRIASPEEAEQLLDALPEAQRPLWATAFYGGLRRGELKALRCSDINIKAGLLHVTRSWDDYEGEIDPKSKKGTRDVPLVSVLSKLLAAHMLRTGRSGDDLVFGATATRPFTPSYVYKLAREAWTAANTVRAEKKLPALVPIGLHECRHTFVSLMFAAGEPLETIGDFVGHSSTYMTDKYRHLLPGSHDAARVKLDKLLAAAKL